MFDNESDRPSHHIPNKPVLPTPRANFFRNSGVPTLRSMQTNSIQTANVPMNALRRLDSFQVLPRWLPL